MGFFQVWEKLIEPSISPDFSLQGAIVILTAQLLCSPSFHMQLQIMAANPGWFSFPPPHSFVSCPAASGQPTKLVLLSFFRQDNSSTSRSHFLPRIMLRQYYFPLNPQCKLLTFTAGIRHPPGWILVTFHFHGKSCHLEDHGKVHNWPFDPPFMYAFFPHLLRTIITPLHSYFREGDEMNPHCPDNRTLG